MCEVKRFRKVEGDSSYRCLCLRRPIYDIEAHVLCCPILAGFCCHLGREHWPNNCPRHEMPPDDRGRHFYLTAERADRWGFPFPEYDRPFREHN